jgi:hypothetical protein
MERTIDCHGQQRCSCTIGPPGTIQYLPLQVVARGGADFEFDMGVTIPTTELPSLEGKMFNVQNSHVAFQIGDWEAENYINVVFALDIEDVAGTGCHGRLASRPGPHPEAQQVAPC